MKFSLPFALLAAGVCGFAEEKRGDQPDAPPSTPEQQLAMFHVPPGFEVQLVAAEPDIQKPLNLNFDAAGRLWATGSVLYPWPARTDATGQPIRDFDKAWKEMTEAFRVGDKAPEPPRFGQDTVRILSDFGSDGRARKIVTFADGLNIPTGIQPLPRQAGAPGETAIVFSIPNIWRMTDGDGDGRAEIREPLYEGFGFTDTHGMSSNYLYWIDGWIYGCHGFRNHSEVRDRSGRVTVFDSGNTYRFRPDGSQIEYYTHGQTNPFGLTVDPLGNFFSADSHSKPVMLLIRGGYYAGIGKEHDGLGFAPTITDDDHGSSSIAGIAYYADDKFPEEYRGNLFNGNPVTRRINRDRLEWHGSSPRAIRMPDFLTCDDPWFRPVQVKLGPDGALWIADFYNPIIGHYEVPLTDPRRDHAHGRIWRVVWKGGGARPETPASAPDLTTLDTNQLIEKLTDPNLTVRALVTHEMVERGGKEIIARLMNRYVAGLENFDELKGRVSQKPDTALVHALWALSRLGGLDSDGFEDLVQYWGADASMACHYVRLATERAQLRKAGVAVSPHAPAHAGNDRTEHLTESDFMQHYYMRYEKQPLAARAGAEAPIDLSEPTFRYLLYAAARASSDDPQLRYALRLTLKSVLQRAVHRNDPIPREARYLAFDDSKIAEALADVCVAVRSRDWAEFLLSYLERTRFEVPRAADYFKYVVRYVDNDQRQRLLNFLGQMKDAPLRHRLAMTEALHDPAGLSWWKDPEFGAWTRPVIDEGVRNNDPVLIEMAIRATRVLPMAARPDPLERIVRDPKRSDTVRAAALEALPRPDLLRSALKDESSMTLRKKAAELLGKQAGVGREGWPALLASLPSAPAELATSIAIALAKSDAGCVQLLDLVEAGKAAPALLRSWPVAYTLAGRERGLRDRAEALTRDLPPEDARLDKVIAERTEAHRKLAPDAAGRERGALVFEQHCVACHRFRNVGGNVGPNLDGVAARGVQRLIEDILDPNRNVDPAFRQTVIETHKGETFIGVNKREESGTLRLTDAAGKELSIPLVEIKTQTASRLSLMPTVFETQIPASEFDDLLRYLIGE